MPALVLQFFAGTQQNNEMVQDIVKLVAGSQSGIVKKFPKSRRLV